MKTSSLLKSGFLLTMLLEAQASQVLAMPASPAVAALTQPALRAASVDVTTTLTGPTTLGAGYRRGRTR
ncbi:hypothetical protein [Hymenobacter cellulosilyticus]|uniref:Uncharacterized protein n=1 Tax=Hymenobacter cellulosilyticus TaxID=2932248 RepID=A0A8T9QA63_9BACT|nr:hypothetical protein [Hymenobacter cellulosilyticus]UOQ74035.1 hypothetical protein MUN79_09150 [Hymenobacter cellulosilyticus]